MKKQGKTQYIILSIVQVMELQTARTAPGLPDSNKHVPTAREVLQMVGSNRLANMLERDGIAENDKVYRCEVTRGKLNIDEVMDLRAWLASYDAEAQAIKDESERDQAQLLANQQKLEQMHEADLLNKQTNEPANTAR